MVHGRAASRHLAIVLAVLACAAYAASPAAAATPRQPAGTNLAPRDGCQRNNIGSGTVNAPQWVYVYRDRTIRKATGISHVSLVSIGDNPLVHDWQDFTSNLNVDRRYRFLLAGTRARGTGNFSNKGLFEREIIGRLHYEWEAGTLPSFAWPHEGDRTTLWGSWIWDCQHWTNSDVNRPGARVTGEKTEFHPLNAIVVDRREPYRPRRNESQTDVFISNQGTGAHSVEECALTHHPVEGNVFDEGFNPCARNRANYRQPLLRSYSFFVPAPPKPAGAHRLTHREVTMVHPSGGRERVRVESDGLAVTVTPSRGAGTVRYGRTFFVSWDHGAGPRPTPLDVTLRSLLVRQADPNPDVPDPEPPPWALYLNVNGSWKLINDWVPGLFGVHDGQRFRINRTMRVYVPHGGDVWFNVSGRECDIPRGTVVFGISVPIMRPCPMVTEQNPDILKLLEDDDTGSILARYPSVRAALGTHTARSKAKIRYPGTGLVSSGDGKQGEGAYELTYEIRRG